MISLLTLLVAVAGVLFGVYQWRRQRGRIRIDLDEVQDRMYIRVVVDAPTPIHLRGIAYQIRARGWLLRLIKGWANEEISLRTRVVAMWRFRGIDLEMGWMILSLPPGDLSTSLRSAFSSISGPELPATIPGYDDRSWVMYGADYVPRFKELLAKWPKKNVRIRFRVPIAGHPRRVVHSRWVALQSLSMLDERNAWLVEARAEDTSQISLPLEEDYR